MPDVSRTRHGREKCAACCHVCGVIISSAVLESDKCILDNFDSTVLRIAAILTRGLAAVTIEVISQASSQVLRFWGFRSLGSDGW